MWDFRSVDAAYSIEFYVVQFMYPFVASQTLTISFGLDLSSILSY
uniref:Uncharacterized protein n=1 Tax=Heterorhabditis bacteriophora TaxID=37862 RepID=A0A1I7WIV5_HETBA